MNILTFDIEEWYIEKFYKNAEAVKYKAYDYMLFRILDLLDKHNTKATFFCLGSLVEHFPYVIKEIDARGHEIGCHSLNHRWVNKMTEKEFYEDTYAAVSALRDATGQEVLSYRAPAFSIGESNKWAFDVLAKCGIKNDASIFPGIRDFGGFPSFGLGNTPCKIQYNGIEILEFPITMTKLPILGKSIAYSGGGYFRLLPINFIKSKIEQSNYAMCYFHINDLLDFKSKFMTKVEYERYFNEKGTFKDRLIRYAKANIGRKRAFLGLTTLLSDYEFFSVHEASKRSEHFPIINLGCFHSINDTITLK